MSVEQRGQMPRICIISPFAYPLLNPTSTAQKTGGAELQLTLIGKELSRRGYEVHFIVDDFAQPKEERIDALTVHKVGLRYMGGSNLHLLPAWLSLLNTLYEIDADIHILKLPRSIMPPLGLYCRLKSKQLILVGQSAIDFDFEQVKRAEGLISFWFYRFGMRFVTLTAAQNQLQATGFREFLDKDTVVIKNAVSWRTMSHCSEKSLILWVGRNLENKHPEIFIELAKCLVDFHFVMIMAPSIVRGDQAYIDYSRKLPNFEYMGFLPFRETEKFFDKAKLLICTSEKEGFPNVFLQAWQARCPVVSIQVDPDDVIKTYDLGRVTGNFDNTVKAVETLMQDDKLRERLAENGTQYVERHHSIEVTVDKYEEVFSRLLQ